MKKQIPVKKILAAVLCCAIPLFFLVIGVRYLIRGGLPDPMFLIAYVFVPLAVIVCACLVIFLLKNLVARILLCIGIYVLYISYGGLFLVMAPLGKIEVYTDQEALRCYASDETLQDPMPEISDLGDYETVSFYNHWQKGMFGNDTDVLILTYEESAYRQQRISVECAYSFLQEPITKLNNSCDTSVNINGYTFCVIDLDRKQYYYPHHMMLIGYNDATCEIVYMMEE